ncbi:Uncharacterised protein [uncultured archaeon]|nr:Uncharacterised protein [uncultured archaeon]
MLPKKSQAVNLMLPNIALNPANILPQSIHHADSRVNSVNNAVNEMNVLPSDSPAANPHKKNARNRPKKNRSKTQIPITPSERRLQTRQSEHKILAANKRPNLQHITQPFNPHAGFRKLRNHMRLQIQIAFNINKLNQSRKKIRINLKRPLSSHLSVTVTPQTSQNKTPHVRPVGVEFAVAPNILVHPLKRLIKAA